MKRKLLFLVTVAASAFPLMVLACSDSIIVNANPRQNAENCSFSDFGVMAQWSAKPARELGNGKIGQLVVSSSSCPHQEKLLFVDCTIGKSISVDGVYEPSIQAAIDREEYIMLGGDLLIKYIQPPFGPVGVSSRSTVESVEASASKGGYAWSQDIVGDFLRDNDSLRETIRRYEQDSDGDAVLIDMIRHSKSRKAKRPFDPMCGCKLFYPDSAGAKM
jgi:hypothetical protein